MNANELADELKKAPTLWFKDDIAGKWIIEKLRQQQAEIEALKKEAALQRLSDFTQEAEKTLTNEEISDIRDEFFAPDGCNIYTFARALLKKAQGND